MSGKHHILSWILNQRGTTSTNHPYSNMIEDEFPAKEKRDKVSLIVVAFHKRNHYDNNQSNIIHTLNIWSSSSKWDRNKNHYWNLLLFLFSTTEDRSRFTGTRPRCRREAKSSHCWQSCCSQWPDDDDDDGDDNDDVDDDGGYGDDDGRAAASSDLGGKMKTILMKAMMTTILILMMTMSTVTVILIMVMMMMEMTMMMAPTVRVGCGSLVSEGCWPPVCVCGAAEEKWNSTRRLQQHLHRHHQHQKHSGWLWRKEQNEIQQVFFQPSTSPRLYLIKMNSISKSFGTRQMVSRWVEHIFKWVVGNKG